MTVTTATHDILLAHAAETEALLRPAPASIEAARKDGAFALRTPIAYGGTWADAERTALHLARLGRACPSTAWVAGTCATSKTMLAAQLGERAAARVFADPDALTCGSGQPGGRAVRTGAGLRVTGRWQYVSGCADAAWASLGVMLDGTYAIMAVPLRDLSVEHTWDAAGMRGTGSHTLVADDLSVPEEMVRPAAPPGPAARLFFGLTLLAPMAGAARGALDVVIAMFATDRKPFMTAYARMGDSPGARHWLAEAGRLVDRAERAMLDIARADGSDPAGGLLAMAGAARDCQAAIDYLLDLHGTAGFAAAHPLQRFWRDVAVGSRHPMFNRYLAMENLATALLDG
ncbi:acyl-CoA dehydrogenase family protein [Actinoplanes sp. L3-i22]|uniref:acyl-CoA dehydrogenase family protein n=1 Tax=Actinoplanes sp. L3-i22 TaxID=2836373 RepID=UPI001C85A5A4|nr:acyl-CoA dehydrogenase family protein [Actinoplanes sp. L3-i22]